MKYRFTCESLLEFFVFAALVVFSASAALALDSLKSVKQYRIDSWSGEEMLPQASVQCIYQTEEGYLWIGTMEGMVRFDGVRFVTFNKMNEPAFRSDDITAFLQRRDKSLWIGTWGGGVMRLHDGRFSLPPNAKALSDSFVYCLAEGEDGSLLVGTNKGLWRIEATKASKVTTSLTPDPCAGRVNKIEPSRNGGLWIGTDTGVLRLHDGKAERLPGLTNLRIRALCEDRNGRLWAGSTDGLYCWDGRESKAVGIGEALAGKRVQALLEDRDGNIWAGVERSGLVRLHRGEAERLTIKEGLSDDDIISLAQDREGNLWVGSFRAGINRVKDGSVTAFDRSLGLSHDCVWSIFEDSRNTLWIGTEEGLNSITANHPIVQHPDFKDYCVLAMADADNDALWVGTYENGLGLYRKGQVRWLSARDGVDLSRVSLLFRDGNRVFVGGAPGGLYCLENGRFRPAFPKDKYDDAGTMVKAPDGTIWVGTDRGVVRLSPDGASRIWDSKDGLAGDGVNALLLDSSGVLWIGADLGLSRLQDGSLTSFKVADGLPNNTITRVLEDDRGNLWLASSKGIFRISKKALEEYAEARSRKQAAGRVRLEFRTYDKADGMKSSECNSGNPTAGWKRRDGSLWFPTMRGAVRIMPANLRANQVSPPVHVEELVVDGRSVALHQAGTRAPAGSRQFEFRFTGLCLYSPAQVRFRYRLEGFDDAWIEPELGRDRIAHYTNLPPGDYTFRVLASNNDGVWSQAPAGVRLVLPATFYQTYWFYALCAVCLVLVGGALYYGVSRTLASWRLTRKLTRYHSEKVLHEMSSRKSFLKRGLASERRRISIFFSDLGGFQQLVERLPAQQITRLMNDYLGEMVPLIDSHGGVLTGFQGEGLMGLFGAPEIMDPGEQARRAVRMAVAMHRRMAELRPKWREAGLPSEINLRIGIAQDYVTVGNFGSQDLMEYTAIGAGVNLASRLMSNCQPGRILVSFPVYIAARQEFDFGESVYREFKGFARRVRVAELVPGSVEQREGEPQGVAV